MADATDPAATTHLGDLSPYIYGTTRLGHDDTPIAHRVQMARAAMEAGVWFHTSRQYDDALDVLRAAFDEDRARVPKLIVKIGGDSIGAVREVIAANLDPLGLASMDIGQLSFHGGLADGMRSGEAIAPLRAIKDEGLVGRYLWEIFPWTSDLPLDVVRAGHASDLIDGYIFYLNPLQRFVSNPLWDLLVELDVPIVAMRTVAGGPVHRLRDEPGFAWKEYLQQRAVEVAPIFERSGVETWSEFCVRFAHSFAQVQATVGSTANAEHFSALIATATEPISPLPADIVTEITDLHRRWSDDLDVHAEPWSM